MDWKERVQLEYKQLKERYDKLHNMIVKYEAGTLEFTLNCPLDLLKSRQQQWENTCMCWKSARRSRASTCKERRKAWQKSKYQETN